MPTIVLNKIHTTIQPLWWAEPTLQVRKSLLDGRL